MPFLRDEGPPVSKDTIQRARESLPLEYGYQLVNETGREVLLVRVPKAKPDYLHDLGDVAFYVNLDTIRNCKDILLIGHEKTARLEPQLLRDNIRAQDREDAELVTDLRRRLGRDFGQLMLQSPSNHVHQAFAVRIPKPTVKEFGAEDVKTIRALVEQQRARFEACQYAYVVADRDHERLGRRVLIELIGVPATSGPAPAPAQTTDAAPSPGLQLSHLLPPTPGTAGYATSAASASTASASPDSDGTLPSFLAAKTHVPSGAVASGAPVAPALPSPPAVPSFLGSLPHLAAPTQAAPEPIVASAPAAPAETIPAAPVSAPLEVDSHEEYSIISKPKPVDAAPAPRPSARAAPTIAANAPPGSEVSVHEEYEIVAKPKPAEASAPIAVAETPTSEPEAERKVSKATEEFEVYTSKPRAREAPTITPPGQGGFQAALNAATSTQGHAPMKTKQYEIMGGNSAPASAPIASHFAASAPPPAAPPATRAVLDDPRVQPALAARAPTAPPPSPDNGAAIVPTVTTSAPELLLASRFKEAGYEVVEGLRAQGTQFAFAAHKPNGRRVLLKRSAEFGGDEAAALAQLTTALGADICIVVAERIAAGTRLATWGTRIEVYTPSEATGLSF